MIIRIGIDPDIDGSGVAIMIDGKLDSLHLIGFHDLLDEIEANFEYTINTPMTQDILDNMEFYMEDVELINTVWDRPGINQSVKIKIAQNVGMVKAVGRLIKTQFERCYIMHTLIPPLKGYLKRGKKDAKFFNKIMGWSGKSNADNRDAALLLHPFLKRGV